MFKEIEKFEEIIKQLIPINCLSAGFQDSVMDIAEIVECKSGDFVFKAGSQDNYFYYVINGELELISDSNVQNTIVGGSEDAKHAVVKLQPRQFSGKAKTPVVMLKLDKHELDKFLTCESNTGDDIYDTGTMAVSSINEEDSNDWMTRMLQLDWFSRLPMANIQQLFTLLEPVPYKAGATVVEQGGLADYYYFIREGSCQVTRSYDAAKKPIKLANLSAGSSFGEEALLTNTTRNATVKMLTDGVVLRLAKDSFMELIKQPSLMPVSFEEAQEIIKQGGKFVDVRFAKEYKASHLHDSINIPLSDIRIAMGKLDSGITYVTYCDTGGRSSAAAFLMTQRDFDVYHLESGLDGCPQSLVNDQMYRDDGEESKSEVSQNKLKTDNKGITEEQVKTEMENKKSVAKEAEVATKNKKSTETQVGTGVENKKLAAEKAKIELENKKLAVEKAKIEVENKKLAKERSLMEKEKAELEKQKAKIELDKEEIKEKKKQSNLDKKKLAKGVVEIDQSRKSLDKQILDDKKKVMDMMTQALEQIENVCGRFEKQVSELRNKWKKFNSL